ncbi:hypothetical protein B1R38_00560 [Bacillus cereus]|uniref:Uncharacterized protein n=1 Tax=Bacillus thuringiensis serovar kumamotoensis TaxID=132267 RepID=A0A9X6JM03_BACUK|nr:MULTISPECIES: hypothetical protein [Bacillus cereus group]MCU4981280.1 hypothetical protein [Bacillus cereus]MCU5668340.1 hypothetical protein [Bacillus cereus]MEB9611806.1 hypothetical protein [Bacillus cereus]MEC2872903.1 hypothetical protein [Bacillus cereus]OTZ67974.1 hypothetical protein BK769_29140 [Bacillus thuringiensis serovar kumamtoensis]
MFKKLVVGALAAGIALTGGIGAASADTATKPNETKQFTCKYDKTADGKYKKEERQKSQYFSNTKTEQACGGTIVWYLKGIKYVNDNGGEHVAYYEGWIK